MLYKMRVKKSRRKLFYVEQNPTEYAECRAFYEWTQWHSLLKENVIKIVNEGRRSIIQGRLLKKIGLSKGVPDYIIPIANKNWHSLWLEMKTKDEINKPQRKEQVEWIERLLKQGHYATFVFGSFEAIQITTDYLNNRF